MEDVGITRRQFAVAGAGWALGGLSLFANVRGIIGMNAAAARGLAERRREELVRLLEVLVRTPSAQGTPCAAAQAIVQRYLETQGYQVDRWAEDPSTYSRHPEFQAPPPGTTSPVNLVGRPANGAVLPLAMFSHIDTEIAGPGWATAPTEPAIRNGRMYGLGTSDAKGGVAAMAVAAAILTAETGTGPTVMCLHGKGGGARGSLPAFVRRPDIRAALYVHPAETGHGMSEVKHVSRGVVDVSLVVRGWRAEPREIRNPGSAPLEEGGDALAACLAVVSGVRKALPEAIVNLGRMDAGDAAGTVPDTCRAAIRVLFAEPLTASHVLEVFRDVSAQHASARALPGHVFGIEVEANGTRANPAAVAWDDPWCRALRAGVEEITGQAPVSYRGHLASDLRFPIRINHVPALGIGSVGGDFYGPDEWVDLDDLVRCVAVLLLTISRWDLKDPHPLNRD